MKLHNNQIGLLRHLARFQMLAYPDCLEMLDTEQTGDRTALSYAFRPLTKNKYVSKQKDGGVSILAKGRALFPDITPLISAGGGAAERRRVMAVSRMAALMERSGIPCFGERRDGDEPYFIPSACWRNIAHGILSTTRFTGMLMAGMGRWSGRCGRKARCFTHGTAAMQQRPRGCSLSVGRMPGSPQPGTSSGRPCGTVGSCFGTAVWNATGPCGGLGRPLSFGLPMSAFI